MSERKHSTCEIFVFHSAFIVIAEVKFCFGRKAWWTGEFVWFSLSGTNLFMKESTPPSRFQRNKRCIIISIAITSVCLLALILGLAIGLTRHHQGSSSGNSDAGVKNFPQEFVLSGNNFTISSQPTTRYYEFNITQRNGSPDGYQRTMLVVNGN